MSDQPEEEEVARHAHWQPVQTDAGWHVRLVGANGETVLTSEVYQDPRQCADAIVLASSTTMTHFLKDERTKKPDGNGA